MSQKLKVLGIFIVSAQFLASCSSTYQAPESFDEKIARYRPQTHSKNQTPELPGFAPKRAQVGRAPASIPQLDQAQALTKEQEFVTSHSAKKLYFLTLYTQYQKLAEIKHVKSSAPEVCPHFHSTLIEHREHFSQTPSSRQKASKTYSQELIKTLKEFPAQLAYYPELALPTQANELRPRVIDLIHDEAANYTPQMASHLVDEAIAVHLSKTHSELAELCEFGSSDNYYIYENLVSKIERDGAFKADPLGTKVIMKTGPVFNQALIHSLVSSKNSKASRSPASQAQRAQETYQEESLQRLQAKWMAPYFKELEHN